MDDTICYELRVISTATSVKWYRPKSFPSFKASLKLSFSRKVHAHMLQRLFETSVQPNTCNFFLWPSYSPDMSPIEHAWDLIERRLVILVLQLQKTNFCCAYKQYEILFHKQTFKVDSMHVL
ncbi:uncharacterized protein TNCV_1907851 [Trichonephila clavipes]|nr:uncharacterized protein TNCV_1907851 [Trichonephila clavipes]